MKYFVQKNSTQGFTLIELLVVIAIIGILASVVLASLSDSRAAARDAARMSEAKQLQTALELYRNNTGGYPCYNPSPNCVNGGAVDGASVTAALARTAASVDTPQELAIMTALNFTPTTGSTFSDGISYILRNTGGGINQGDRTSYSIRVRFESKVFPTVGSSTNPYCTISVGAGHTSWNGTGGAGNYPPCF